MTKNAIEKSSDNQLHDNFAVYCASGEVLFAKKTGELHM